MIGVGFPVRLIIGRRLIPPHIPPGTVASRKEFNIGTAGAGLNQ